MELAPYDDAEIMFRIYPPEQCDTDGYPFLWRAISKYKREAANNWCRDCGYAYREARHEEEKGNYLTVHHFNENKADCRWNNLIVFCWLCHEPDHMSHHGWRHYYCRRCKQGGFLGWQHYARHLRGIHGMLLDGSKIKKAA